MAAVTARAQPPSSSLTSIRRAWNVRLAGWPLWRCEATGMTQRSSSTRRADVVNGSVARARTMAAAILRANRSSP